ncbi:MAG: hypothetical protein M1835_003555, partial [Candelina submexicana]
LLVAQSQVNFLDDWDPELAPSISNVEKVQGMRKPEIRRSVEPTSSNIEDVSTRFAPERHKAKAALAIKAEII